MTHIEQMIQDMCPNGVEWKTFDELGVFYGGLSGKTKDDFKDGNEKFITYLNIASNPALCLDIDETVKIGPNEKQNIVQYGDALFTGSSETPDECAMSSVVTDYPQEKLYLNSFCFGFRFNSLEGICPAFYKHYFRSDHFRKAVRRTANGTTRFNVSKKEFGKLAIPLPPLEIQKKSSSASINSRHSQRSCKRSCICVVSSMSTIVPNYLRHTRIAILLTKPMMRNGNGKHWGRLER